MTGYCWLKSSYFTEKCLKKRIIVILSSSVFPFTPLSTLHWMEKVNDFFFFKSRLFSSINFLSSWSFKCLSSKYWISSPWMIFRARWVRGGIENRVARSAQKEFIFSKCSQSDLQLPWKISSPFGHRKGLILSSGFWWISNGFGMGYISIKKKIGT